MTVPTIMFWQLVQAVLIVAVGAIEQRTPFMLRTAPPAAWEIMIVLGAAGNLAWMAVAVIRNAPADMPSVDWRGAVRAKLFPPPPAARRAYAARTRRERRVIP